MSAKNKPPAGSPPKTKALLAKAPQGHPRPINPLRQADSRWQRTARYGWDKGGANGGRKP